MSSALEELGNKNILYACFLFEKLEKAQIADLENDTVVDTAVKEKDRFHIFDLLNKIMISWNEIPLESITLPIFKYWCSLMIFVMMDDNPSEKLMTVRNAVAAEVYRFFFKGLIHLKKMNIRIVDVNINAQKSESLYDSCTENFLMLVIKRINNCETIQDLIDSSPTAECPICMDVTFTETTHFEFRLHCNHLVCHSCQHKLIKFNNGLVKK